MALKNIKNQWASDVGAIQGETSSPAPSSGTKPVPILGTGKDKIMRRQTDGFSRQEGKVIYIRPLELKQLVCSHCFIGNIGVMMALRNSPALQRSQRCTLIKIHVWQQSNKWLCLCLAAVPSPRGHSSSALIEPRRSMFSVDYSHPPTPPFCLPRISPPLLSSFTYHWRLNKTLQHIVHLLEMHLNTLSGSVFLFSVVQITPFSLHQLPQPHRSDRSFTAAYGRQRVGVFYIYMLLWWKLMLNEIFCERLKR